MFLGQAVVNVGAVCVEGAGSLQNEKIIDDSEEGWRLVMSLRGL